MSEHEGGKGIMNMIVKQVIDVGDWGKALPAFSEKIKELLSRCSIEGTINVLWMGNSS